MLIDLLNSHNPSKSTDNNPSQLSNMYLEEDKNFSTQYYPAVSNHKGKYNVVAYPTPGLDLFCDTGKANVRALYTLNDVMYVVAGNTFYTVNSSGTKTSLGTLNTSSGFAKIRAITGGIDTNNQLLIIDGTNGYTYNTGTSIATFPITDVNFPQTATDVTTQD